jgi:hypothetical protein
MITYSDKDPCNQNFKYVKISKKILQNNYKFIFTERMSFIRKGEELVISIYSILLISMEQISTNV